MSRADRTQTIARSLQSTLRGHEPEQYLHAARDIASLIPIASPAASRAADRVSEYLDAHRAFGRGAPAEIHSLHGHGLEGTLHVDDVRALVASQRRVGRLSDELSAQVDQVRELARHARDAADGDSNDAEIEALQSALDAALELIGVEA